LILVWDTSKKNLPDVGFFFNEGKRGVRILPVGLFEGT